MKTNALLLLLLLLGLSLHAQKTPDSGSPWVLGGSIGLLAQNNNYPLSTLSTISGIGGIYGNINYDTKNTQFSFNPYLGKQISAHWLLGLQLNVGTGKISADDYPVFTIPNTTVKLERKSNEAGAALFARYTVNTNNALQFFLQPSAGYHTTDEKEFQNSSLTQEEQAHYLEMGMDAGVLYNITKHFRASLHMGAMNYINGSWEIKNPDSKKKFSSFGTNLSLSGVRLGAEWLF